MGLGAWGRFTASSNLSSLAKFHLVSRVVDFGERNMSLIGC